ncbi:Fungal transcription factor [Fusarium oxysporum f. sp. vasinfectum]|nr:Fungal transcription factor [Fusarium oxysporum f. sp. vasinfectum]
MKCVLPTISPIIESDQHCSVRTDLILAALPSNSTYLLHCCLRVAAQHLKSHTNTNISAADIDSDFKHHYCLALEALVETLKRDEDDHEATLEAVLGLILFQSAASRYDDLHDVSWHQYFGVALPSVELVEKLTTVLQHIPSGPDGFDRNVAWVYLISGSISVLGSPIRAFFEDRLAQIGGSSKPGTMGRLATVLHEVWLQNDNLLDVSTPGSTTSEGGELYIHWREVMESKGWDFLFI